MLVTLRNDLHNTETTLRVTGNTIGLAEAYMAWRALCGVEGCTCGNTLGMRGPNPVEVIPIFGADGLTAYRLVSTEKLVAPVLDESKADQWNKSQSLPRAA